MISKELVDVSSNIGCNPNHIEHGRISSHRVNHRVVQTHHSTVEGKLYSQHIFIRFSFKAMEFQEVEPRLIDWV